MNDMTSTTKKKMRSILAERDGWVCKYCGMNLVPDSEVEKYTTSSVFGGVILLDGYDFPQLDHVFPRSKGGENTIENLVLSCGKCNMKKGAR